MPKLEPVYENPNGWSDWIAPVMRNYKLGCCDCGLVHDLQFKVLEVTRNGKKTFDGAEVNGHRVLFRARRNKQSTRVQRRGKKVKVK